MRSLFKKGKAKDLVKGIKNRSSAPQHTYSVPPEENRTQYPPPTRPSAALLAKLPGTVLERIFGFVCPHSQDNSYEPSEGSANENGCMLCDQRDLAHCVQVCQAWRPWATKVLYHTVRIDAVHYCDLEGILADSRKKTSRFDKNGIPEDPGPERLKLFRRTVRDEPARLGTLVQFFKIPYMIRESCHSELAQTVAVLPNLRYVDLPEGVFADDPKFSILRLEVQARCPNIRSMTFNKGAEHSFSMLASGQTWRKLEVLELNGLTLDPWTTRTVLSSLPDLHALKVTKSTSFSDEVLCAKAGAPMIPLLEELVLKDTPNITTNGLVDYLSSEPAKAALKVLTLNNTGVTTVSLGNILVTASALTTLAFQIDIAEHFPTAAGPLPMISASLETLRYEIFTTKSASYGDITGGYYAYLASSILADGLPKLRRVFVRDDTFPDRLHGMRSPNLPATTGQTYLTAPISEQTPPMSPMSPGLASPGLCPQLRPISNVPPTNRFSSNNPFAPRIPLSPPPPHMIEIFTKSDELSKWNFARVDPTSKKKPTRNVSERPVSSYGLGADVAGAEWESGARKSIMVGNGTAGFLAVPVDDEQQTGSNQWHPTAQSKEARGDFDLWR